MTSGPNDVQSKVVRTTPKMSKRTILLIGPSGTGKTHQYRCLQQAGMNGLYVDVEGKYSTLYGLEFDRYPVVDVDMPLIPTDYKAIKSDIHALWSWLSTTEHQYDFVYFDSLMRYGEQLLSYLKHTKKISGFDLWGSYGEKMVKAVQRLTSLAGGTTVKPIHVVVTCGVEMGKDWKGRRLEQPLLDGNMIGPRLPYFFEDVLRTACDEDAQTGKQVYAIFTRGTNEFNAKVSSGATLLDAEITNPDLAKIIRLIEKQ